MNLQSLSYSRPTRRTTTSAARADRVFVPQAEDHAVRD